MLASGLSCAALLATLAGFPERASPQSQSASFAITRQGADGGGGRSGSASYGVEATVGQPDAGPAMSSASYTLRGGFHRPSSAAAADTLFRDGFEPI
jgi:hypothetical protein